MDYLISNLREYISVPNNLVDFIFQKGIRRSFKARSRLLSPDEVQYDLIFVVDGIVRNYYKKDNLEWTSKFLKAGDFVLSIDNFLFDLPCGEYIETCTPVEVIMFSKGDYEELLMQYPELNVVAKKIGDRRLRENNSRMYNWRMLSSAERYNQFVQQNPDLVKYVQLQHIASYLDISPYNLSRIRSSFKSMSGELGNSIKRTF